MRLELPQHLQFREGGPSNCFSPLHQQIPSSRNIPLISFKVTGTLLQCIIQATSVKSATPHSPMQSCIKITTRKNFHPPFAIPYRNPLPAQKKTPRIYLPQGGLNQPPVTL